MRALRKNRSRGTASETNMISDSRSPGFVAVDKGRNLRMRIVKRGLSDDEVWQIIHYLRSLAR
jgi:hypothetical protein